MDHIILMQLTVLVSQDVAGLVVLPQLAARVQHGGV